MPNWIDKSDHEIIELIKKESEIGDDLLVVGRFVNFKNKASFINIRNKNFVPLTYVGQGNDYIGKKLKIEIKETHNYNFQEDWYEFKIKLCDEGLRRFLQNPTLVTIDLDFEPKLFQPNEKEFVLNLYNRKSSQNLETDRGNIQSLRIIEREINRVKEAFIYELLQNADDYPQANKKVDVKIFTTENEFIFTHNGSQFKFNNVYALCNINDGDKQDDADKIGYKGIGFKSVFAYSDKVAIKSGKYIFKFDKTHREFQRDKPFQIIPIWIDSINNLGISTNNNVNIIIETKQGKIQIDEWKQLMNEIFSQDSSIPVILFLRNIRNVSVDNILVSQTTKEWWIRNYELKLSNDIKAENKRLFETNTGNIPEKLVGVDEVEIQFSLKHTDYEINTLEEAILYNYLPTKVNLGFNFLINSDFIPTGDRHYLFENEWNKYLMKEVGLKLFDWFITLNSVKHKSTELPMFKKDYLKLLPNISDNIQDLKAKSSNNLFLLVAFNEGLKIGLLGNELTSAKAFIPTQNGELETLSNILIDETGFTELLKDDLFKITGITQKLINIEVGQGIEKVKALINEYNEGVIYTVEQLKIDLKTPVFQEWLKITANNFKVIQYLYNNKDLKSLLKTEKIVLSESKELFKVTDLYSKIPDEVAFITNNKVDLALNALLVKEEIELELKPFNSSDFYKVNVKTLNSFLTNESNISNIWCFIYDNWIAFKVDDEIKNSLNQLNILCKPTSTVILNIKTVSSVYISKEFAKEDEVETIIETLKLKDKFFIESKFISTTRTDIKKWNEVLKSARAKNGLKDVITELVTQLPSLEDTLHFKACFEIFNYWKTNKEKPETQLTDIQINLIKQNLKIQCTDNEYHSTDDCIISDHYNNNQLLASWLPILKLPNQVSPEYSPKTNHVSEWKNFLFLIGCIELTDKQNVFDAKIDFYINSQEELQEIHFETLKNLSDLYRASKENGLNFDLKNPLSKINLETSNEEWHLPNKIHLSSTFCNSTDLDLQKDEEIEQINYLTSKYKTEDFTRDFFKKLGVKSGFEWSVLENTPYDKFPNQQLAHSLMYSSEFQRRRTYLLTKYKQSDINKYSNITNHIEFYCLNLVISKKYNSKFIDFIKKNKQSSLFQQSSLINYGSKYASTDNNFVSFIKTNETISNQNNELKKPTDLFSLKFEPYISDKSLLPKTDFNKFNLIEAENLEEIFGIQQFLNESHCIELLCRTENRITIEENTQLQIVEILSNYAPTDDEKKKLFFLNTKLEWKPLNKLFISGDEQFQIDPKQKLHDDFIPIAGNFGIQELSEDNLILKTSPKSPVITKEIEEFFKSKGKFIAYKIDQSNYETILEEIIENIALFQFHEVLSIAKVSPEINPIYKVEIDFYLDEAENKVFFQGNWKTNKHVIDFIFSTINSEIERKWFENVINRWDDKKIIETLIDLFGSVPPMWIGNFIENDPIDKPQTTNDTTFKEEVESFILSELENNEWRDYIPELKNILELSISHPKEKQKLYNLIAKLKLARHRNIHFEKNEQEFNHLSNGTEKYFVHSARGSFAYIHTNEILRMKNDGYKMALDFGSKSEIKIYENAEEILELNTNHLLLYQYDKPIEALFSFCEANKEANKHLLIIDRDNSRDKSNEMFKLLNPEDDYQ